MINTCALWGATTYTNSWLSINILVIVASLLAIAVAYSLSSFFGSNMRGKMRGFIRFEMIQLIVSILILAALLAFSSAACAASSSMSRSLSHQSMDPFQYADYYIGSASLGNGLTLLSNIYSTSVTYSIYAAIIQTAAGPLRYANLGPFDTLFSKANHIPFFPNLCNGKNFCDYERIPSVDLSQLYGLFAAIYLNFYSPIILIAVGLLFIQFLMLPIMQYTAFTIILPVAIGLRSISFFGASLGDAANALLAIAIAFYIIYPMTVAFDSYAIAYVFSPSNPAAQYVNTAFTLNSVSPNAFFQSDNALSANSVGSVMGMELSLLKGSFNSAAGSYYLKSLNLIDTTRSYTNNMAQFIFQSVLLFALNISITVGLAMSVYKALRSGLGEAGRFW